MAKGNKMDCLHLDKIESITEMKVDMKYIKETLKTHTDNEEKMMTEFKEALDSLKESNHEMIDSLKEYTDNNFVRKADIGFAIKVLIGFCAICGTAFGILQTIHPII